MERPRRSTRSSPGPGPRSGGHAQLVGDGPHPLLRRLAKYPQVFVREGRRRAGRHGAGVDVQVRDGVLFPGRAGALGVEGPALLVVRIAQSLAYRRPGAAQVAAGDPAGRGAWPKESRVRFGTKLRAKSSSASGDVLRDWLHSGQKPFFGETSVPQAVVRHADTEVRGFSGLPVNSQNCGCHSPGRRRRSMRWASHRAHTVRVSASASPAGTAASALLVVMAPPGSGGPAPLQPASPQCPHAGRPPSTPATDARAAAAPHRVPPPRAATASPRNAAADAAGTDCAPRPRRAKTSRAFAYVIAPPSGARNRSIGSSTETLWLANPQVRASAIAPGTPAGQNTARAANHGALNGVGSNKGTMIRPTRSCRPPA